MTSSAILAAGALGFFALFLAVGGALFEKLLDRFPALEHLLLGDN